MQNSMKSDSLPNYDRPPVVEMVLGVQFNPLDLLTSAHLGAYWKALGSDWSNTSDATPIESQIELFSETGTWRQVGMQLRLKQPGIRLRIKNRAGDRMLQLQNGRMHFNWLGESGKLYPHFDTVFAEFWNQYDRFRCFLAGESLGEFSPNQWEITYVNHIPRGTVWNTPADWSFFQLLNNTPDVSSMVRFESFAGEWHFEIPERRGRIHIKWTHGSKDKTGSQELIALALTSRGPVAGPDEAEALKVGLHLGRATIVKTFRDLMSEDANTYWGLHDGNIS
jgi:uncharacterized protein (TIGR04255 family)